MTQKHFIIPLGLISRRNYQHLMQTLLPYFRNNAEAVKTFVDHFWPEVHKMNAGEIGPSQFIQSIILLAEKNHQITLSDRIIQETWQGMTPNVVLTVKDLKETLALAKTQGDSVSFYSSSNANDIGQILKEIQKDSSVAIKALQLAQQLSLDGMPLTIFNEHMFELDSTHKFCSYQDTFIQSPHIRFAVPTLQAVGALPGDRTDIIGHLSLDSTPQQSLANPTEVKTLLDIPPDQDFAFVVGTTQPPEVDVQFLDILLRELQDSSMPMQVRFGIHPGVKPECINQYLSDLLLVCEQYPLVATQFKIVLNASTKSKLDESMLTRVLTSPFVRECEITGPQAAEVATHIAQAVPGALPTQFAMAGKPVVTGKPAYLPDNWFKSSSTFFAAKPTDAKTRTELGLTEDSVATRFAEALCQP